MVVRGSGIGLRVRVAGRRDATARGTQALHVVGGRGHCSLIKISAWRCLSHSLLSFAKPNPPKSMLKSMKPPKIGFFVT
jgi:hypothetical protein